MSENAAPSPEAVAAYAAGRHNEFLRSGPKAVAIPLPIDVARTAEDIAGKYYRRQVGAPVKSSIGLVKLAAYVANAYTYYRADFEELTEKAGTEVAQLVASISPSVMIPATRRMHELNSQVVRSTDAAKIVKLAETIEAVRIFVSSPSPLIADTYERNCWCDERLALLNAVRDLNVIEAVGRRIAAAAKMLVDYKASWLAPAPVRPAVLPAVPAELAVA